MDMAVGDHDGHASGVMDSLGEVDETVARDKPEWTTPNRMVVDLAALRLRDFSVAQEGRHPALVVAPFALHDAAVADLAPGHSLVETLLANGCSRLFLAEWKSATMETRLHTIDTQLAALNVAVDDTGPPADLIGLCQGGWLSLVYAARFPRKVRRLVLAGAPVDITAAPSALSTAANPITGVMIDELIRLGDGLVRERHMARRAEATFTRWDRRTLDLPAPYYRQVLDWFYRENRLAVGTFPALGRRINLRNFHCPLFLLAGARDLIAPPAQVFAAASLVAASESDIETAQADCGHLALFMGQRTLTEEWPRIARWLAR